MRKRLQARQHYLPSIVGSREASVTHGLDSSYMHRYTSLIDFTCKLPLTTEANRGNYAFTSHHAACWRFITFH